MDNRIQEVKYREMREILNHLPMLGVSVQQVAQITNMSVSTIYNLRNGLFPSETKYRIIMSKITAEFPFEVAKAKELIKGEDAILGVN